MLHKTYAVVREGGRVEGPFNERQLENFLGGCGPTEDLTVLQGRNAEAALAIRDGGESEDPYLETLAVEEELFDAYDAEEHDDE